MKDRIKELDDLIVTDTTLGPALFETLRAAQHELGLLQGNRATCPYLIAPGDLSAASTLSFNSS